MSGVLLACLAFLTPKVQRVVVLVHGVFSLVHGVFVLVQGVRDLTLEMCSKKPAKRHMETPFEEKVNDRLHYHN